MRVMLRCSLMLSARCLRATVSCLGMPFKDPFPVLCSPTHSDESFLPGRPIGARFLLSGASFRISQLDFRKHRPILHWVFCAHL